MSVMLTYCSRVVNHAPRPVQFTIILKWKDFATSARVHVAGKPAWSLAAMRHRETGRPGCASVWRAGTDISFGALQWLAASRFCPTRTAPVQITSLSRRWQLRY